jgi:hypothetical protein
MINNYNDCALLYGFKDKNRHPYRKVLMSKNMSILLEVILLSLKEKDGVLIFAPDKEQRELLLTFNNLDVVDCFERLKIDDAYFSKGISDKSRFYVMDKMIKLRSAINGK